MVQEVDAVLPRFAEQIMSIESRSGCNHQMRLLIVEILILIHSKMGLQIEDKAQSEQIERVVACLQRLSHSTLNHDSTHSSAETKKTLENVGESQSWILSSVHHFLPTLIRTLTTKQQLNFIPLLVDYVNGSFGENIKIS